MITEDKYKEKLKWLVGRLDATLPYEVCLAIDPISKANVNTSQLEIWISQGFRTFQYNVINRMNIANAIYAAYITDIYNSSTSWASPKKYT